MGHSTLLYSTLGVWDGEWDSMTDPSGGGIYVRTRIPPKVFTDLERLAQLRGLAVYALTKELVIQGIRAYLGTAQEHARLREELAGLETTEAEALEDLASKALERRMKEVPRLLPGQAIIAAFNTGDEEGGRARFNELTPRVQKNLLLQLRKEAPDLADRLQVAEGDVEDP